MVRGGLPHAGTKMPSGFDELFVIHQHQGRKWGVGAFTTDHTGLSIRRVKQFHVGWWRRSLPKGVQRSAIESITALRFVIGRVASAVSN